MGLENFALKILTKAESIEDITPLVEEEVWKRNINVGFIVLFAKGSTCALSTMEFEPGLKKDVLKAMEKVAPASEYYAHHEAWHDDNGRGHVRATFVGPSLVIPIRGGKLTLGTWQQIVFFNFDTKDREREIECVISSDSYESER